MAFDLIGGMPVAAVATNGTITFQYPAGRTAANYNTAGAVLSLTGLQADLAQGVSAFSLVYGGPSIVVTYLGSTTIPAMSRVTLQAPLYGTGADGVVSPQAAIADLTEGAGAIGGTNDGDIPTLTATAAALTGTLTGTANGSLVDVAATAAATAGGATPTAAQVDTGIAAAVASIVTGTNEQLKELQAQVNKLVADDVVLRAAVREDAAKINAMLAAERVAGEIAS